MLITYSLCVVVEVAPRVYRNARGKISARGDMEAKREKSILSWSKNTIAKFNVI